jgi:mono/diheme cytochrome c family protein
MVSVSNQQKVVAQGARVRRAAWVVAGLVVLAAAPLQAQRDAGPTGPPPNPQQLPAGIKVVAPNDSIGGLYLTIVGGCQDCHTPNWTETQGKVPPADQLIGTSLGYRGPWGTSYAANLRAQVARQDENRWVKILTTNDGGDGRLPMTYHNTAMMSETDLRAMYRYIKSLGAKGERVPRAAKPDSIPKTPYIQLTPVKP